MMLLLAAALLAAVGEPVTPPLEARPPVTTTPPTVIVVDPTAVVAPAAAASVMIDRPADADPVLRETTLRLRAELATAGYGSQIADCAVDPLAGPADCPRDRTLASISLARVDGVTTIFVTSKLRSGLELRRHLRVSPQNGGGDATLLAVRAVELLRDLQLEVAQAAQDPEDPKPLEFYRETPATSPPRVHLLGGAQMLFIGWSGRATLDPTFSAMLGVGVRFGQRVLAVLDGAGPFATSLPIGSPAGSGPSRSSRELYQVIGRLSARVGLRSPVEGPFASVFAGLSYMQVQLDPRLSNGAFGQAVSPLAGVGLGYTARITSAVIVSGELDLIEAAYNVQLVTSAGDQTLTESGHSWVAFNVTAAVALP